MEINYLSVVRQTQDDIFVLDGNVYVSWDDKKYFPIEESPQWASRDEKVLGYLRQIKIMFTSKPSGIYSTMTIIPKHLYKGKELELLRKMYGQRSKKPRPHLHMELKLEENNMFPGMP